MSGPVSDFELESLGVVVVLDAQQRIVHVSAHCQELFGVTADRLVGADLSELLVQPDVDRLTAALEGGVVGVGWVRVHLAGSGEEMKLHAFDPGHGLVGLDILPLPSEAPGTDAQAVERVAGWTERLLACESATELLQTAAAVARERTGFDGAWITRLESGGHSTILASDTADGRSLAGRRVPPSDVPPSQPRAHGRLIPIFVADLEAPGVQLVPAAEALDLQGSALLRPFPAYLAHLTEIGVRALASVPIVVDGRLWGRIASANSSARRLTAARQAELNLVGLAVGNRLSELLVVADAHERVKLSRFSARVVGSVAATSDLVAGLVGDPGALINLCDADAAIVSIGGETRHVGEAVDHAVVAPLLELAREALGAGESPVASTTSIGPDAPGDRAVIAGFLAVQLAPTSDDVIVWLRGEQRQQLTWLAHRVADVPAPATLQENVTERVEERQGHSAPWTDAQVGQAEELRDAIGEVLAARYREVQSLNELLTRSNEEYDAFTHAAAHDLKAPLRGIRLTTELLQDDLSDRLRGDESEQFDLVLRLADAMGGMLGDLLAYARVSQQAWRPEAVDVGVVANEALELLGGLPDGAELTVEAAAFRMDPSALRQVLLNLIGNALKYSGGPARVSIAVASLEEVLGGAAPPDRLDGAPADTPVLVVTDHGIGIDASHHERIFDLFQQLDPSTAGSGSGLAVCRLISRRHGGEIWVRSALGQGATFHVAASVDAR